MLTDTKPDEAKSLVERKIRKPAPRTAPAGPAPSTPAPTERATEADRGAADVASILNAVDEDVEGGEEAELPQEFEYYSDGEGGSD